ncbi:MAG: 3-deoxy-manno-octulosonate cytidylyltransferase [Acidobacteriaceae bacterium]|nr:3-deoxy-manno-octulosonate cytidylyltransferase [Acidobacteriaceae bacterium]
MKALGVIPARYQSSRFPGKPLADLLGKPMIQHVYEAAKKSRTLTSVVVATDDERIADVVRTFDGEVVITRSDHASGTDRVAEVARHCDTQALVNIQGDEPLIDPVMIDECLRALPSSGMSTLMKAVSEESFADPGVVQVVSGLSARALYFSRSLIPYPRTRTHHFAVYEHIGLYAYTRDCLLRLAALPPTPLEQIEGLEQLRALENGIDIQVVETKCGGELVSVDTPEDVERVREILAARTLQ